MTVSDTTSLPFPSRLSHQPQGVAFPLYTCTLKEKAVTLYSVEEACGIQPGSTEKIGMLSRRRGHGQGMFEWLVSMLL